jgi:REP element-mobilizing transposase RayT
MWNDTDTPLAYFISFRCYGTWLHGDERGSIDRFNNLYGTAKIPINTHWNEISRSRLVHEPVKLNARRRRSVGKAIRETCQKRNWGLLALNVRTNHVHVVVAIGSRRPEVAITAFKANATRQMREDRIWDLPNSPWSQKGSNRYLWTEKHVADAVEYVVNGQGKELPKFD